MNKAQLLLKENKKYLMNTGKIITIATDLWLVPKDQRRFYPNGLKFGWIAFNDDNPDERILVDYNPKKGFHYHLDEKPIVKLKWVSLENAQKLFAKMVQEKFGEFIKEIERHEK